MVQAPILVLHRTDTQFIPIEHGRYLAEHLPRARLVELSGSDPTLVWEAPELVLDTELDGISPQIRAGLHTGEGELRDATSPASPSTSPPG